MRVRDLGSVALVGALCLGVAGCGEDSPKPSPVVESSKSSLDRSPSAPAMPSGISSPTKDAAKNFVRYYLAVLSYASATGDTAGLEDAERTGCNSCTSARQSIDAIYAKGGRVEGKGYEVRAFNSVERRQREFRVVVSLHAFEQKTFNNNSDEPQSRAGEADLAAEFYVLWTGTEPSIADWSRIGR